MEKSVSSTVQDAAKRVETACATLRGKGLDLAAQALSLGNVVPLGDGFGLQCLCFNTSDTRGSKTSDGILSLTRNSNTVKHIANAK